MANTGKIFINYRRSIDLASAGRLADYIHAVHPEYLVFMDVRSLMPGQDFAAELESAVEECRLFLAIIGHGWIDARGDDGQRRLDSGGDFVRLEIEAALKHGKHIVPILIGDAKMPAADQLPKSMKRLASFNAFALRHERFRDDSKALIDNLGRFLVKESDKAPQIPSEFTGETGDVQKIVLERCPGWEFKLTSELLGNYLRAPLQRWRDLSERVYIPAKIHIPEEEAFTWLTHQLTEATELFSPLEKIAPKFEQAWGLPGIEGDAREILHACKLFEHAVGRAVKWEEQVHAVTLPLKFLPIYQLLPGTVGTQIEKLSGISNRLNEIVEWAETHSGESRVFEDRIVFELPEDWEEGMTAELNRFASENKRNLWSTLAGLFRS